MKSGHLARTHRRRTGSRRRQRGDQSAPYHLTDAPRNLWRSPVCYDRSSRSRCCAISARSRRLINAPSGYSSAMNPVVSSAAAKRGCVIKLRSQSASKSVSQSVSQSVSATARAAGRRLARSCHHPMKGWSCHQPMKGVISQ